MGLQAWPEGLAFFFFFQATCYTSIFEVFFFRIGWTVGHVPQTNHLPQFPLKTDVCHNPWCYGLSCWHPRWCGHLLFSRYLLRDLKGSSACSLFADSCLQHWKDAVEQLARCSQSCSPGLVPRDGCLRLLWPGFCARYVLAVRSRKKGRCPRLPV